MNATAKFFYLGGAFLLYQATFSPTAGVGRLPMEMLILLAVVAVTAGLVGHVFEALAKKKLRAYRDWDAEVLATALVSQQASLARPAVFLYFRPFKLTGQLHVHNPKSDIAGPTPNMFQARTVELESVLREDLEPYGALVGLGRPGEADGAGRVDSNEASWRQKAATLAMASDLILLVPSDRPGTVEEMKLVAQAGYLGKTIFLMPPEVDGGKFDVADEWSKAKEAASALGLALPDYQPEGAFLAFASDGRCQAHAIDMRSKTRTASSFLGAAGSLGRTLTRRSSRTWRVDVPPPPWLAYAALTAATSSLTVATESSVPDTLNYALHGWLLGLLFARYLPVPRLATPILMMVAYVGSSILAREIAYAVSSLQHFRHSHLLYLVVGGLLPALVIAGMLRFLHNDKTKVDQVLWPKVVLVLAVQPILWTLIEHVVNWASPVEAYTFARIVSQTLGAAVAGWLAFRYLLPDGVNPQTDPGSMFLLWPAGITLFGLIEAGSLSRQLVEGGESVYRSVPLTLGIACGLLSVGLALLCMRVFVLTRLRTAAIVAVWIVVAAIGIFGSDLAAFVQSAHASSGEPPSLQTSGQQESEMPSLPQPFGSRDSELEEALRARLEPEPHVLASLISSIAAGIVVGLTGLIAYGRGSWRSALAASAIGVVGFVSVASLHLNMIASAVGERFGSPMLIQEPRLPSAFAVALLWACLSSLLALLVSVAHRHPDIAQPEMDAKQR
jgi:hypothetical protein